MAEITMPKMSDAMEEGTLLKWLKHEGDTIQKGEPIAEIETDKATLQMEAYESGVLTEVKTQEGETVPVGTPIAVVEPDGKAAAPAPPAEAPPEEAPKEEARVEERPPVPPEAPPTPPPAAPAPPPVKEEERIKASPLAQKMAQEAGIDLRDITGTGPGGRIVEADVREYIEKRGAPAPAPAAPPKVEAAPPAAPVEAVAKPPAAGTVELSRIRKTIAKRMIQSKQTIPHFYVTSEVIMDDALKLREQLNTTKPEEAKISVTDLIIKACSIALMRIPEINASWADDKIQYHEHANVAIAVSTDEGLIAPVVPECDVKSLSEIAVKSRELINKVRNGTIRPEEYSGGTFTVSNLGQYDVEDFVPIIVPPESAILAVATIAPRSIVLENQIAIKQTVKLTLSADHRITDGVGAARFLKEVKGVLQAPFALVE
ncbi:MAG: dihydrolipoamide acetyltransferase family protein [Armatimonadota bacterium]|nr:dihydrolipoamide acetyltransferase family protein [Armatimonadota bacterium]